MEKVAHVKVKDCFKDDNNEAVYFVVETGQLGKAVGKGGMNIKRVQQELGKKIRVIEYNEKVAIFVRNIIYPFKVEEITEDDLGNIIIKDSSKKTKSLLIGRQGRNLNLINRAVKRFFNKEVKII